MILQEYEYYKEVIEKHFKKNLIMREEEEEKLQLINIWWIFKKLIVDDDGKVRDHCHITGKFRDVAYWNWDLQLTKNVSVIFHNLTVI